MAKSIQKQMKEGSIEAIVKILPTGNNAGIEKALKKDLGKLNQATINMLHTKMRRR